MESKSKIFQPKVIIGSITSFIVAAVGIIAVFFPNLLNLEKSSMGEGQFLLSDDEKTHKKLWEFLESNQGKVVQLEIAYCADFEKMNFAAVKDAKANLRDFCNLEPLILYPNGILALMAKRIFKAMVSLNILKNLPNNINLPLLIMKHLANPKK